MVDVESELLEDIISLQILLSTTSTPSFEINRAHFLTSKLRQGLDADSIQKQFGVLIILKVDWTVDSVLGVVGEAGG